MLVVDRPLAPQRQVINQHVTPPAGDECSQVEFRAVPAGAAGRRDGVARVVMACSGGHGADGRRVGGGGKVPADYGGAGGDGVVVGEPDKTVDAPMFRSRQ